MPRHSSHSCRSSICAIAAAVARQAAGCPSLYVGGLTPPMRCLNAKLEGIDSIRTNPSSERRVAYEVHSVAKAPAYIADSCVSSSSSGSRAWGTDGRGREGKVNQATHLGSCKMKHILQSNFNLPRGHCTPLPMRKGNTYVCKYLLSGPLSAKTEV